MDGMPAVRRDQRRTRRAALHQDSITQVLRDRVVCELKVTAGCRQRQGARIAMSSSGVAIKPVSHGLRRFQVPLGSIICFEQPGGQQ